VEELTHHADRAWGELDQVRDTVVALGAPPLERDDVHAAWRSLLGWCDQEQARRRAAAEALDQRLAAVGDRRTRQRAELGVMLTDHHVPLPERPEPDLIGAAVVTATAHAEDALRRIERDRRAAVRLRQQIRDLRHEQQVAHELALRLRADAFERWLCGEALELLVTTASHTLRELSDGQFELVLDDRNAIDVIDYAEAGMRRSARTLSGGETFQASLALALALSDQIAGFATGGTGSLDSIFLDEGFGTLDPATLDTVATTLERLADGDRMVGIVTHVPALAERIPVRFEISRDGTGSHLEKRTT
jgi:DNA repair protein SbcC/Rad50